ncbi:hypothetical protein LPH44_11940 (plasmid) [Xylella taiwanensis]|uniref:Lipoprotein n=1 Tax=Xylella taiwanensis TaxID=1444770 RepID=A0ABS8TYM9_9GAMM|nr:hypothetical protein [Xylella taiwanensis]MCD8459777.1 hypothetical protein [Xylella taiwanensis]MCD8474166.1 hypothetical protein [Xylella taiwanensis]UFN08046.1 hypothetical protein LPH42_11960 [Xylella taiwanensis]UFN10339.1 hypothetical protein LPH45_11965 [Xylella taiwanensis]UFN12627.1 hypothetical protein LPH44_11940 [Xylella taiwanensis]
MKVKILMTAVSFALIAFISLTACQSHPQLKKVAKDAAEKPINTPEAAENIKKKYEK